MIASFDGHVDVVEALINGKAHVDAAKKVCVKVDFVILFSSLNMTIIAIP